MLTIPKAESALPLVTGSTQTEEIFELRPQGTEAKITDTGLSRGAITNPTRNMRGASAMYHRPGSNRTASVPSRPGRETSPPSMRIDSYDRTSEAKPARDVPRFKADDDWPPWPEEGRWPLLIWYATVLCFISHVVGCPDLIRRLLILNDTAVETSENTFVQKQTIETIVNRGFVTATASSFIIASFCNYDTPRMNAVWGLAMFLAGHVLLYIAETPLMNTAGIMLIGATFSASFNAHVSITALFPARSEMVYDVLSAVPDISTIAPYIILWIFHMIDQTGGVNPPALQTAVQIYLGVITFVSLIHIFTIPSKPFNDLVSKEYEARMEQLPPRQKKYSARLAKSRLIRKIQTKIKIEDLDNDYLLSNYTLIEQVVHPLFWVIGGIFASGLFRKYHVLSTFRFTVFEYALQTETNPFHAYILSEALNISNSLAWAPATFLARLSTHVSAWLMSAAIAITSFITCAVLCIPNVHIQWITVLTLFMWSSLIYTYLFVGLAEYFGKTNVNNLQGLHMLLGSLWSFGHPLWMEIMEWPFLQDERNEHVYYTPYWRDFRAFEVAHLCILALSFISLLAPLYEWRLLVSHVKKLAAKAQTTGEPMPKLPPSLNTFQPPLFTPPPVPPTEESEGLLVPSPLPTERRSSTSLSIAESEMLEVVRNTDFSDLEQVHALALRLGMDPEEIIEMGELFEDATESTGDEAIELGEDEPYGASVEELNSMNNYRPQGDLGMGNLAMGGTSLFDVSNSSSLLQITETSGNSGPLETLERDESTISALGPQNTRQYTSV